MSMQQQPHDHQDPGLADASGHPPALSTRPAPTPTTDDYWSASDAVSLAPAPAPIVTPPAATPRPVDLGWSQAMDVARRDDQVASRYVRLANDGDQATIMVLQPPLGYFAHRVTEGGRFTGWVRCPGHCSHCERGRAVGRYLLDVLDVEARARKLWEPGKLTFRALEALARRYPPQSTLYEITRHGRAGDQRTRYQLLPAGPVTPELRALADKTRPYDLEAESWGESRRQDDETSSAGLPF